jgi:hypothetical protein
VPPTPDVQAGVPLPDPMAQWQSPAPGIDTQKLAARNELVWIDLELARLRASRPRIFWPIALLAGGAATAVFSGAIALVIWSDARHPHNGWDEAGNRYVYRDVDQAARDDMRPALTVFGLGTAAAALGLALFIPRIKVRGKLSQQARPLRERRTQLLKELRYSLNVDRQHTGVAASVSF